MRRNTALPAVIDDRSGRWHDAPAGACVRKLTGGETHRDGHSPDGSGIATRGPIGSPKLGAPSRAHTNGCIHTLRAQPGVAESFEW
jgi:hypothetical protein